MGLNKHQYQNELFLRRRERGLSRKQVAALLGQVSSSMLSRYENGYSYPHLVTALMLEIIYRTPVAYLYYELYDSLRKALREQEGTPLEPYQPTLF